MPYISNTDKDRQEMLNAIGVKDFKELLKEIPGEFLFKGKLGLGKGKSELEVTKDVKSLAAKNKSTSEVTSYLGAGSYDHYIPSVVPYLISRPEFQTAYTPYQAEISQGTLQSIYEYQSLICNLTGMDISNASMYDGASAMAEAAILACRHTRRNKIVISSTVNPGWIAVVRTFTEAMKYEIVIAESENGALELESLKKKTDPETACIIVQNPNFFGNLEDYNGVADLIHGIKGLFIVAIDPISIGLFKKPSEYGADIVVAEGQALGLPQAFGGPYLGIFAATKQFMRKIPGRVVGVTQDVDGKRGFVLTLQTREQHIRRDKATSNICSNQALCALAAGIYLNTMGEQGLKETAENCYWRSHYLASKIGEISGFELKYKKPFFKEFVIKTRFNVDTIMEKMLEYEIFAGIPLKRFGMAKDEFLVAVTEKRNREELDKYADTLKIIVKGL
ncbi:MAG TPA: aminomethyl-transferring glycine dehydrogenase subunit GcvPA [Clostridiales bacterium]|nr:aminomethyl-transferring glycine dehydrogenase subunit GcvPA [Clostridiales bacterium]HQP69559.1 aminomethyl-transferring glycine dehydrogenase subunit GcvPA [Clostridiales bacterium]